VKKAFLLFMALIGMVILVAPAHSVPILQLDIAGGTYDPATETIITSDSNFTLYALFDASKKKSQGLINDPFYIAAALVPTVPNPSGAPSLLIDNVTPSFYTNSTPQNLATHGIFPADYWEFQFTFDPNQTVPQYNTQDDPGGPPTVSGGSGNELNVAIFDVSVSGLDGYYLHFDLYHKSANPGVDLVAPFSHDAMLVPEPASMFLFGVGLLGLAGLGRKRFFKRT
jgi:hypothetical protein